MKSIHHDLTFDKVTVARKTLSLSGGQQVDKTVEQIQQSLENALDISLKSLGGQLASLSNKFVEDYGPLTDKLRDVVRIAEGMKNAEVERTAAQS